MTIKEAETLEKNGFNAEEQLKKMATGYYVDEVVITASKNGAQRARKTKRFIQPHAEAVKILAEKQEAEENATITKGVKLKDGVLMVSTGMVVDLYQTSRNTVDKWIRGGAPKHERGWWDLKELIKWRGESAGSQGLTPSAAANKIVADTRYKDARANIEQLRLQQIIGTVIPVEIMQQRLENTFFAFSQSLKNLAESLYPELSAKGREKLNDGFTKALTALSGDELYKPSANSKMARTGRPRGSRSVKKLGTTGTDKRK